jgi:hypothetical protein
MKHQNFKFAYSLYVTDHEYRDSMVKCGLDSMMADFDSENIVLLTCATNDSDTELVHTFVKAAYELGIELPEKDSSDLWLAETTIELIESKVDIPDQEIHGHFKRNLLVAYTELEKLTSVEPNLIKFTSEFGRFVGTTGLIDKYEDWRVGLSYLLETIKSSAYIRVVEKIIGLINWVSYGATTKEHLIESHKIALELLNINKQREAAEQ